MNQVIVPHDAAGAAIERVIIQGDLSKLTPEQRTRYYRDVCESLGLNPLTKPFEYITLNGKLTLYALKSCTEQLRVIRGISIKIAARETVDDCYVVTAQATDKAGRSDESIGAVSIAGLKGEARANAFMKAETKAKRRVTLSISGLSLLDETEVESIPNAQPQGRGSWRHEYAAMYSELQACGDEDTAIAWWNSAETQDFVKRAGEHHAAKGGVDYGSLLENEYLTLLPKLKKAERNPMKEQDTGESTPVVAPSPEPGQGRAAEPSPVDEIMPEYSDKVQGFFDRIDLAETEADLTEIKKDLQGRAAELSATDKAALNKAYTQRKRTIAAKVAA